MTRFDSAGGLAGLAPTTSTASLIPRTMSPPRTSTRYCGVLPPIGQLMRRRGASPTASAILDAGLSRGIIRMPGVATVSIRCPIAAPASCNARRAASQAKSMGSTTLSPRCVISPTATTTGVRGGIANGQVTFIVGTFVATYLRYCHISSHATTGWVVNSRSVRGCILAS